MPTTPSDSLNDARNAGLRHVSDRSPGFRRIRRGRGFSYRDLEGQTIRDPETLHRLRALAIPPAWTDVWICPTPNGHIQATGRDDRGRKQYRYHNRWRRVRDEAKYNRMIEFAQALPQIRQRVTHDLAKPGLPKEKVLAAIVRLLETTSIRVGNVEYAKANRSFGLTTLRDRHVALKGSRIRFRFRAKHGVLHESDLDDPRLARVVRRCRDLPGQELFQYLDDSGEVHDIGSEDVNDYLRSIAGESFTAKDFRTWVGTVLAMLALQEFEAFDSQVQARKNVVRAIESVAERLGNTPSVCRKCYVHPTILDAYLDGTLLASLRQRADHLMSASLPELRPEEAAVLALLQRRLATDSPRKTSKSKRSSRSKPRPRRSSKSQQAL